jgi:hypothetical protein
MKRIIQTAAIAMVSLWAPALKAESLLRQNFDAFPEILSNPYKSVNESDSGTWYGFTAPGNRSTVESEGALRGKALRLIRDEGEQVSQSVHCYFNPSSGARLSLKLRVYLANEGKIRVAIGSHLQRFFAIAIGTRDLQYFDPNLKKWAALETPINALANRWMEWAIDFDRAEGIYSVRMRFEEETEETVIASNLPINKQADPEQKVLEITADNGGPYFIDEVSLEDDQ